MSIILKDVTHVYSAKTPFEKTALSEVNLNIDDGDYMAIAGHTGSGKSTLIQLIAGLIKPTVGNVIVDGIDLNAKDKSTVRSAKRQIGIVFQYPETQLFEETVEKDIAFGPKNLNLNEAEINERVTESMNLVDLPDDIRKMSPFNLSGGQKRRVAIAGVLAMRPKYLILDEPTAGLDPHSRDDLMKQINFLHDSLSTTIIMVTHSMDDIARFAKKVAVMSQGKILIEGEPRDIFERTDILKIAGLTPPSVVQLLSELKMSGIDVETNAINADECEKIIENFLIKNDKKN